MGRTSPVRPPPAAARCVSRLPLACLLLRRCVPRCHVAMCGEHAVNPTLDALPRTLLYLILQRLPADARARAACVCRAWRTAAADPALWLRLDLSTTSGVTCRVNEAAVRAAAARARGGLEALDVWGRQSWWGALRAVAAANAASLRELRMSRLPVFQVDLPELDALLAAAPALQVLESAGALCGCARARRLLRNEPPFGPLRVRELTIVAEDDYDQRVPFPVAELVAHPWLTEIDLSGHEEISLTPHELDVVVDAALKIRLSAVNLWSCDISTASAPALARLLSSAALTQLCIGSRVERPSLLDAPAAALLSSALRTNCTLQRLLLRRYQLWNDVPAAVELLGALINHISLRSLDFAINLVAHDDGGIAAAAIGAALGAIIAADAPALEELDASTCHLGDAGLCPLYDALPRNTHLRTLKLFNNNMSAACARQRLMPAVRANTSLRRLEASVLEIQRNAAVEEAMQLVRDR